MFLFPHYLLNGRMTVEISIYRQKSNQSPNNEIIIIFLKEEILKFRRFPHRIMYSALGTMKNIFYIRTKYIQNKANMSCVLYFHFRLRFPASLCLMCNPGEKWLPLIYLLILITEAGPRSKTSVLIWIGVYSLICNLLPLKQTQALPFDCG